MALESVGGRSVDEVVVAGGLDECTVDSLVLSASGALEGVGGDPVDVAEATVAGLVEQGDGVAVEEDLVAADKRKTVCEILSGVIGLGLAEREPRADARVERAVDTQLHALVELGQSDEDDGQQRARVPLVDRWAAGAVPDSRRVGFRPPPAEPGVRLSFRTGLSIDLSSEVSSTHPAELVLLDGDPLEDIEDALKVVGVVRNGRFFSTIRLIEIAADAATVE